MSDSSILYTSAKTYQKRIDDQHYVLFRPDVEGLPIVLDELAYGVYSSFERGNKKADVITEYVSYDYDAKKIEAFIDSFIHAKFLDKERSFIEYKAKELYGLQDIKSLSMWLHVTNNCNLSCDYCFVYKKTPDNMCSNTMDKIIQSICHTAKEYDLKSVTIKYAGGEPTLSLKRIKSFHECLKKRLRDLNVKYRGVILSNGTLINEKLADFLKENNFGIGISIDGYGPEGHDIYRRFKATGQGTWGLITKNIDLLKSYGINPFIMSTISRESFTTLKDLVSWVFSNGLRTRLSIVRQLDSKWDDEKNSVLEYRRYNELLIHHFEEVFSELEDPKYYIDYSKGDFELCDFRFKSPAFSNCCAIGVNHIVTNEKGKLASCPMCVNEADVDIANDDLLQSIRKTFKFCPTERNDSTDPNKKLCLNCKWYPVCVGGCPITNLRISGNPFMISTLHDFSAYAIPRYIEFCGKKLLQYAKKRNIDNFHILKSA